MHISILPTPNIEGTHRQRTGSTLLSTTTGARDVACLVDKGWEGPRWETSDDSPKRPISQCEVGVSEIQETW